MERLKRLLTGRQAADLLLWTAITAPVLIPGDRPELVGVPLPELGIAAVPLLGLAVLMARRMPPAAAAVPPALGLAATPELFTGTFLIAQMALVYLLGRRSPGLRPALLLFAAVCAAGLLLLLVRSDTAVGDGFTLVANVLVTLVLPWLAGRYALQHAELVRAGFALAEKLEREQELSGDRARLRERSRIAQDMHDSLGHDLSLIALRAAALQVAPGIGPEGRKVAGEVREELAAATERLREVIGVLREDHPPRPRTTDTVASVVRRAGASGMAVTLDDQLQPTRTLAPMTDRAIHRVVQEGLTNAAKHAPGAAVTVTLRREGRDAVVAVVNTPPEHPSEHPPGHPGGDGLGLTGLDERIRRAGGTLDAGPAGGGFAVTARLPLNATWAVVPPRGEGAPMREFQARRKVRRSMINAILVPAGAAAVLIVLMFAYNPYSSDRTVLDEDTYDQLRTGEPRSSVERRLPDRRIGGDRPKHAPADPPGTDECRFYRTRPQSISPAYRLCFTSGRLSHKNEIRITG